MPVKDTDTKPTVATPAVTPKVETAVSALGEEYFKANSNVGLSGLTVEDTPIPTLSVVQSTSKFRDNDGRPYRPGQLYYKALKMAFDSVTCAILVINKKQMPSYENRDQLERTFMVLGVIMPNQMPFMFYAKSSSYFAVRQFIGEVKALQKPMYALNVQIDSEKRQNDQGEWYVPVFNITGLESNPETIVTLEELAKTFDENRDAIQSEEEVQAKQTQVAPVEVVVPDAEEVDTTKSENQPVAPEEIPF